MKFRSIFTTIFIILWVFLTGKALAQTIIPGTLITLNTPDVCAASTNNAQVSMSLVPLEAGAPITSVSNSDMYLKLSSNCPGGTHREITARIGSGSIPTGTKLTIQSANCTTTASGGALGTAIATPTLLDGLGIDRVLVDYIGTMYSGTGNADGYRLTYTWSRDMAVNYDLIQATQTPVVLTIILTVTNPNSN